MSQKFEDILNLALETPEAVREQTDTLNIGFDGEMRTWELIVKYHGSLDELRTLNIIVEYLIAGYAILTVPENLVERMAQVEQIEYVEKPKRYYYQAVRPAQESCIPQVTLQEPYLSGENVLIAVLDSGIEYRLPVFQKADGSTRIRFLWDQTLQREFTEEEINQALQSPDSREQYELVPSRDVTGHGTAVAGIAAGSVVAGGIGGYSGVAPEADLLVVKLGTPNALGFPRTTEIMRGVVYALQRADELQMPLVINLSFGNCYGSHDGSSLLERFLDNAAEIGRTVICVGSGNEGSSGGHTSGNVAENTSVEVAVARYEPSLNIQLWKNYSDVYRIYLRSPGGQTEEISPAVRSGIGDRQGGKYVLRMEQTDILVYWGAPAPYSVAQEVYLEMIPAGQPYVNSGVWTIFIEPVKIVTGQYYLYLPSSAVRNEQTQFYRPTPQVTLTIPSTAAKVLTIGAYDSVYDTYADFSGRGYADENRTIGVVTAGLTKPDIVAPGVGVLAPDVYGNYMPLNGTSFATPIVSGSAALLMEWGIARGNDPFLYGEKMKAYLRAGARPLRGEQELPNDRVGFGALCVAESLPG
ncbi:MAG: S8 family serine peptidase [Bacteroidales bacterium]|nr:S8 family serine peptidase [Lachnoclostridium sp.]MCM1383356.1 S8 family serine peptidase [Lachnoclostridium sp.]MCM1465021.1 S8 family serine peptidase [Bacteroidales bacterium]